MAEDMAKNDIFADDKIGREPIVKFICTLVDGMPQGGKFCMSLDGPWGSGKSFVLDHVQSVLKQNANNKVVKYDAWENSYYSDPLIAILSCLLDDVKEYLSKWERIKDVLKECGKKTINALFDMEVPAGFPAEVKTAIGAIKALFNLVRNFAKPVVSSKINDFKSYQTLLSDVKKQLKKIMTATKDRSGCKLVILVDEIDRCLPADQLTILERLHHLFDIEDCAVIIAINKQQIEKSFNALYGGGSSEYLRKFFDYNYIIEPKSDTFFANRLSDIVNTGEEGDQRKPVGADIIAIVKEMFFAKAKNTDNREIERWLDNLRKVYDKLSDKLQNEGNLLVLSCLLVLRCYDNDLYKYLRDEKGKNNDDYIDIVNLFDLNANSPLYSANSYVETSKGRRTNYRSMALNYANEQLSQWYPHGRSAYEWFVDGESRLRNLMSRTRLEMKWCFDIINSASNGD